MRSNRFACKVSLAALMIGLSGCSSFTGVNQIGAEATAAISASSQSPAAPGTPVDMPYLLGTPVAVAPVQPAPLDHPYSLVVNDPESLQEVASKISALTGINVRVDTYTANSGGGSDTGTNTGSIGGLPPPPSSFLADLSGGSSGGTVSPFRYPAHGTVGSLGGLLDTVATAAGESWRWDNGSIVFFNVETKIFDLPPINHATKGTNTIVATAGANSSAGSAGAASTSGSQSGDNSTASTGSTSITDTTTVDLWKDISDEAKTQCGGAVCSVDPSIGTITATGTPVQLERISDWVDQLNDDLAKNVWVTIDIYSVQLNNEENYGFNPSIAFNNAAKSLGLSFAGVSAPTVQGNATPASLGASILSTATGAAGEFSSSEAVVQALNTLGKTNQRFHRSITTLNDESAPIQNATQTGYLESTSVSSTAQVGTTASLNPGAVTTGFTGSIIPHVIDNKIILRLDFTISGLVSLLNETSDGSSIQLPTTNDTATMQGVALDSGKTLMITAYDEDDGTSTNNGVGSPFLPVFGGGGDAQVKKTLIAIVVTARTE